MPSKKKAAPKMPMHKMPGGHMMKDSEMGMGGKMPPKMPKAMPKKGGKRK